MSIDRHALLRIVRERVVALRLSSVADPTLGRSITQTELAAAVGVSRATIANVENGRQNVSIEMLYRIADVLGADPRALLPDVDEVCVCDDDGAVLAHADVLPATWIGAIDEAT